MANHLFRYLLSGLALLAAGIIGYAWGQYNPVAPIAKSFQFPALMADRTCPTTPNSPVPVNQNTETAKAAPLTQILAPTKENRPRSPQTPRVAADEPKPVTIHDPASLVALLQTDTLPKPSTLPPLTTVQQAIEHIPSYQLETYLGQFFKPQDLGLIGEKPAFAKNLAREYLDEDNAPMSNLAAGQLHFSSGNQFSDPAQNTFQLTADKNQPIYAHFELHTPINNPTRVFIRWKHLNTGQVLLFTQQMITAHQTQNWVNFTPSYGGWQTGSYSVRIYQFDSALKPLLEGQYYVN